jgi:hypothetical protein
MIFISDACPVQMWLNGVLTFNERLEPGIEPDRCFKQIFNNDDEIRVQYQGVGAYNLKVTDIDGNTLYTTAFTQVGGTTAYWEVAFVPSAQGIISEDIFIKIFTPDLTNGSFTGSLTPWVNWSTGDDWVYSSNKASWTDATGSALTKALKQDYAFEGGIEYTLTMDLTTNGNSVSLKAFATDGTHYYYLPNNVFITPLIDPIVTGSYTFTFTLPTTYNYTMFGIRAQNSSLASRTITIDNVSIVPTELATSDYVDIRENHYETQLIQYSNRTDYAGLSYQNSTLFQFRVRTKFFEERFPQESESEGLSDGEIVKLSSTVKNQKFLEVESAPPYIHRKVTLILSHNTVYMDSNYWTKEESYDLTKLNDRYPFFLGKCWLTLKNSNFWTNIFGTERVIS